MKALALPLGLRLLQRLEFPHKLGILERLYGGALFRHAEAWVDTAAGIPWKLDLRDPSHRWIVYGKYEGPGFWRWASRRLAPTAIIVDSGANIGQTVIYFSQIVPRGRILAFEPGAEQAAWLAECLRSNPALPVELIQLGLGAAAREARLNDPNVPYMHGAQSRISYAEGEPIRIVRLDDQARERGLRRIDLWKLDVEGYEIPALEGAQELIEARAIDAIYIELHKDNGRRIIDYLEPLGYFCHLVTDGGTVVPATKLPEHVNGLFLPRARAAGLA